MQKRVLILIDKSSDPNQIEVFSSAKVLLERSPDLGIAYGTVMNNLSRADKPYIKGHIEIHRSTIQRAEKGA